MTGKKVSYKEAYKELESIITQIESNDPDVDELASMVKRAAALIKECKNKLRQTESDLNEALEDMDK